MYNVELQCNQDWNMRKVAVTNPYESISDGLVDEPFNF